LNDRIGSAFYTTKNNANTLDTFFSTEAGQVRKLQPIHIRDEH